MKVMVKRAGQAPEICDIDAVFRSDCKSLILESEALIEFAEIPSGYGPTRLGFIVDEEGIIKGLPHNFYMPINRSGYLTIERIRGDAVFFRYLLEEPSSDKVWDYRLVNLEAADINVLNRLLKPDGDLQTKAAEAAAAGAL